MVAPDPLARPVPNGRNRHDGKEPTQVASARRLPLCGATDQMRLTQIVASNPLRATRFGEADGRTAPLLSETENAPSNTTQPHCGEGVVRGTARGRPSSAALRDLPTTRLCRVLSVRTAHGAGPFAHIQEDLETPPNRRDRGVAPRRVSGCCISMP